MGAQGRKGRRKEERRLADFVFKMAESVMADDYAIFKSESRPVNLAFLRLFLRMQNGSYGLRGDLKPSILPFFLPSFTPSVDQM